MSTRAGRYVTQLAGYRAFVPKPLPPDPPMQWDAELLRLLSTADRAVGNLNGLARALPNPDLFVAMYVRREAVLSSQIEGTQSSIDDLLAFEIDAPGLAQPIDVAETVNYVKAMNTGLRLLGEIPLSGRLIRTIHRELLTGDRGQERQPGEFRRSQNWIGPAGCTIETATFVPPSPDDLAASFGDLEGFLHDRSLPPLVHAGLAHAQFETINPFLDGNGRVGRLLITLLLVERSVLDRPLLYLSVFLRRNRTEYYERLGAIRTHGDWEGWMRFFLAGVAVTADDAAAVSASINDLRAEHVSLAAEQGFGRYGLALLDLLARQPLTTASYATKQLGASPTTVGALLDRATELGIVEEITGRKRNRVYRYSSLLDLFTSDSPDGPGAARQAAP